MIRRTAQTESLCYNNEVFSIRNGIIFTQICLLYSAIAECNINSLTEYEQVKDDLRKLIEIDIPDAEDDLADAVKDYNDFVDSLGITYFISFLGGGPLGLMGANIWIGVEATRLWENYLIDRKDLQDLKDEQTAKELQLETFHRTHDYDDIFNEDFLNQIDDTEDEYNVNDGGCNDGGCNDGGCNDGDYT